MKYLVVTDSKEPFLTNWFDEEKFIPDDNMIVFDLVKRTYTTDGKKWVFIKVDHL